MKKVFFSLFLLLLACPFTYAQSINSLDSSFAASGIYIGDSGAVVKMAVQPDGRIVIVDGERKYGRQTMAMRFNSNGSIDSSFAENGRFYPPTGLENAGIVSVCLQPDGKIIIAGTADTGATHSDLLLLRLKGDGTIDSSFGGGGYVLTSYDAASDTLASIALQPDGKIIAYGYFNDGQDTLQVMRYHTDGSPDSSFGMYGRVKLCEGFTNAMPNNIAMMPDGRIVVGGDADINALNGASAFIAIRLLPDGSLDTAFNHTGMAYTDIDLNLPPPLPFLTQHYACKAMRMQTDGKVLFIGHVYLYNSITSVVTPDTAIIVRLDSLGKLDSSFGGNGAPKLPDIIVSPYSATRLVDMLVQSDGKIVFGINSMDIFNPTASYVIFFMLPDGSMDNSLYWGGSYGTIWGPYQPYQFDVFTMKNMVLQPDGKLLVGGYNKNQPDSRLYIGRHFVNATPTSVSSSIQQQEDAIAVYPNPAAEYIYIDHPAKQTIRKLSLYSLDGKRLLTKTYPYADRLSTEGLANGIYYLKLSLDNHQQVTKKIIIQKD